MLSTQTSLLLTKEKYRDKYKELIFRKYLRKNLRNLTEINLKKKNRLRKKKIIFMKIQIILIPKIKIIMDHSSKNHLKLRYRLNLDLKIQNLD
jgi:hypothetical protein